MTDAPFDEHLHPRGPHGEWIDSTLPIDHLKSIKMPTHLSPNDPEIQAMARDMREHGWSGKPVQVEHTNKGPVMTDGHHRLLAAEQAGLTVVPAREYANTPAGRLAAGRALMDAEAAKVAVPAPTAPQLETHDYEGRVGDTSHITRVQTGRVPTAAIEHLMGKAGETPGAHRNRQGERWNQFKDDVRQNGVQRPVFITVDPGEPPKISEGNHRRDAAVETGQPDVPVEIRYFGHAEQGSGGPDDWAQRATAQPDAGDPNDPGHWDRSGDEPRWVQSHAALLNDALWSWKGDPVSMELHMEHAKNGEPQPSSGSGKKMRAQAEALRHEIDQNGKTNEVPLYRGSHLDPNGLQAWTEDPRVAAYWARLGGGSVHTLQPGEARGIRINDYIHSGLDQSEHEWIIDHGVYVDKPGVQASARRETLEPVDSTTGGGAVAEPTPMETVVAAGICTGPGPCDTHPLGHGKNWVNQEGGLPAYIRAIAHAMERQGHSRSRAVSSAIATVKRWASGGGGVSAKTRARAAEAAAQWEKLKAKAHAHEVDGVEAAIEADTALMPKRTVDDLDEPEHRKDGETPVASPHADTIVASAEASFAMTESFLASLADACVEFGMMGMDGGPTHAGLCMKAADTGRVLMLQRSLEDPNDPAAGTWEFPGGGHEDGDQTSLHTAIREWQEEVGRPFPQNALVSAVWSAPNGVYQGHVVIVPTEGEVSPGEGRMYPNPDDPDGDNSEAVAWWHPDDAAVNPALREEAKQTPWDLVKDAGGVPSADDPDQDGDTDTGGPGDTDDDSTPAEGDDPTGDQRAIRVLLAAGAFDPSQHPRGPGGKFATLNRGAGYDTSNKHGQHQNERVKDVQRRLEHLGYSVGVEGVDGMLGPHTAAGIRDFQRTNGLKETGAVDEATWRAMNKTGAKQNSSGSTTPNNSHSSGSGGHAASRFIPHFAEAEVDLEDLLSDEPEDDFSVSAEALSTASPDEHIVFGVDAFDTLADEDEEFAITAKDRRKAAKDGAAMSDGSYPIRNATELRKAVRAFPRGAGNNKTKVGIKRHIIKRAKELKVPGALPETWGAKTASAVSADLMTLVASAEVSGSWEAVLAAAIAEVPPAEVPDDLGGGTHFRIPLLLPTGIESGDRREFKDGSVEHRDLPIPLYFQKQTDDGHKASVIVARIDSIKKGKNGLGDAEGVFDTGPDAQDALRLVRGLFLRGVSGDVDKVDAEMSQADDGKPKVTFSKGRLTAATLVGKPAFSECMIELPGDEEWEQNMTNLRDQGDGDAPRSITAAGGPMFPPQEWFADPQLAQPTHLTVTDDGRVFGHIASWDQFHIGMPFQKPPRSRTGYKYFATGQVKTQEGAFVNVGQLTLAGGHADTSLPAEMAIQHYDDTKSAVADVAIGEDQFGIWVAGAARPELTDLQLRQFRASDSSGDWRPIGNSLELVACLQVNCAGFPVPVAAVASGGRVTALVAAGAPGVSHAVLDRPAVDNVALAARLDRLEAQRRADIAAELRATVASARAMEADQLRATVASLRPKATGDKATTAS